VSLFDKTGGIDPEKDTGCCQSHPIKNTRCKRSPFLLHLVRTASFTTLLVNPFRLRKPLSHLHVPEPQVEDDFSSRFPDATRLENK